MAVLLLRFNITATPRSWFTTDGTDSFTNGAILFVCTGISTATSKAAVKPLPNRKSCGDLYFQVFPEVNRSLSTPRLIESIALSMCGSSTKRWRAFTRRTGAHLDVHIENTCFGVVDAHRNQLGYRFLVSACRMDFKANQWPSVSSIRLQRSGLGS